MHCGRRNTRTSGVLQLLETCTCSGEALHHSFIRLCHNSIWHIGRIWQSGRLCLASMQAWGGGAAHQRRRCWLACLCHCFFPSLGISSIRLAFRERWVERARVRQLRDRERERMRHQPRPHVPPNRFQPLPHQPGLPIIGGDFDRLPHPLLGGGPGMLGMGGAAMLGGGKPFGGGPAMGLGPAFPMGRLGGRRGGGAAVCNRIIGTGERGRAS